MLQFPALGPPLCVRASSRSRDGKRERVRDLISGPNWTGAGYHGIDGQHELERIEALELLGMILAHLNDAEARVEVSPRVPLLMAIRDKLALALREES